MEETVRQFTWLVGILFIGLCYVVGKIFLFLWNDFRGK